MTYTAHPIAEILPLLVGEELTQLADDIRQHGLRQPIVLFEGQILDGRNRYAACQLAEVEPAFVEFDGDNPWRYVWSLNGARRHFENQTQKAGCWKHLNAGALEFERIRQTVKARADAGRSEAAKAGRVGRAAAANKTDEDFSPATTCGDTKPEPTRDHAAEKERKSATAAAASAGVNRGAIETFEYIERHAPDLAQQVINGEVKPAEAKRIIKKTELQQHLDEIAEREIVQPTGLFDVIVIDPPWPMQKIERDCRPNQAAFDYPVMSEAELSELVIPAADDCHVWVWTTHKFLPMAMRLLDVWGLKYVCMFVWHKPGGFQPIGLPQYNCEFVLYARRGSPQFIDTKAFNTCFSAHRGEHSEKPESFYETVRRVTGGRRLDMFNRRPIDGFSVWGKEASAA